MQRVTILCGLGYDKNDTPIKPEAAAIGTKWVLEQAAKRFGGATLTRTDGSYNHNYDEPGAEQIVIEPGFKLEILLRPSLLPQAATFATEIREHFGQATVGYVVEFLPIVKFI